mgnify:FL=1
MTDLSKVLPHNKPMILLDDIIKVDLENKYVTTYFHVDDKKMFYDKTLKGIPSICGIEFMAQTIGCYAFYAKKEETPRIGFLLGSRLYNNSIDLFKAGETYTVKAVEAYYDNEISAFDCFIYDKLEEEVASATINVYQSDDDKNMEFIGINGEK